MRIHVVGAGSWGMALACLLARNGHAVELWCRSDEAYEQLSRDRQRPQYLPGILLPDGAAPVRELSAEADIVVFVTPSDALREVADRVGAPRGAVLVSATKGIEQDSLLRMSEVLEDVLPGRPVVALSGPSHAEEVARELPASLVAAGTDVCACADVQDAFFGPSMRVYTSRDIVGVELGGAVKNVIAIAAGASDGLGLGDNAKAALITRGLAEMARLGAAMGADAPTFAGLSGLGDLIVTCGSRHSRNRAVGEALARGKSLEEHLRETRMVAEGVKSAKSVHALAEKHVVDMPITRAVHAVLFEGAAPMEAVRALMSRDAKGE